MTRTEAIRLAPIMAETIEAYAAAIERDGTDSREAMETMYNMDWSTLVNVLRILANPE